MGAGRPLKFESVHELQNKIDEYFDSCFEEVWNYFDGVWTPVLERNGDIKLNQIKPFTISGLAAYLGTNRQTLLNYESKEEYFDTIRAAKVKIEAYAEESLWQPKIAQGVMFNLKNNFGWQDKQDINMSGDLDINVTFSDDDE